MGREGGMEEIAGMGNEEMEWWKIEEEVDEDV